MSSRPPHDPVPGAQPVLEVPPGTRLGRYQILRRLASGGMAELFLARVEGLPGLEKMVVIKRILPQFASEKELIDMFLDEARIAATLHHPNVVQMHDFGDIDGSVFIAMEYLHGEDVRSIVRVLQAKGERLPLEHALNIMLGVSAGLHYAHEKHDFEGRALNIVHRDVTPHNIIVTYDGGVKLLDFGIAKASNRVRETRAGTLKGKVPYMSPEQCNGEPLDRRSDVFSLGTVLYELTVGQHLHSGANDYEIIQEITQGSIVPPREIDPAYPPALEATVMKALAKDKEERFQTVREVQVELEALVREGRMNVSPIALQKFVHEAFPQKREAWAEVQAAVQAAASQPAAEPNAPDRHATRSITGSRSGVGSDPGARSRTGASRTGASRTGASRSDASRSGASRSDASRSGTASGSGSPERATPDLRPRGGRMFAIVLLCAGLLALGGVAAIRLIPRRAENRPEPPPAPAANPRPPETPPPPSATPKLLAGIVKVLTTPPGATLYLDGKRLDRKSPATVDEIAAATEHVLLVQHDGYNDVLKRFALTPGEVRALDLKLVKPQAVKHGSRKREPVRAPHVAAPKEPAPRDPDSGPETTKAAEPRTAGGDGTLVIATDPWCNVSVDGSDRGPTPLSVKLPAGRHTVLLTNPEYKISRTLSVTIKPGETVAKRLDFEQ